jgi:glycosyltransferase involved in cell wall biosynthesis
MGPMVSGAPAGRWNNARVSNQPRVILVIADSSRTGGPEHVLTLATELRRAAWPVLVVCPEGQLRDRCREASIPSRAVPMSGASLPLAAIRFRHLARRWQPDLIHSHGLRAGVIVSRAGVGARWVHTHHLDGWFAASRLRIAAHRRALQLVGRGADLQIAVSTAVADFVTGEVGVPATKVRTVPNGIYPLQAKARLGPSGATVGTLARLTQTKGIDLAVMALATPAGRELSLRVGGAGPELSNLIDLATSMDVAGRIHFVGEVQDRQQFFDSCDVVWVPSRAEPFGLVACEAMSAGVPVVASRVGGLPEILDPPYAGACVAPANPGALASVTGAILADPERYQRLSAAGVERIREHFEATRMVAETSDVYREALA